MVFMVYCENLQLTKKNWNTLIYFGDKVESCFKYYGYFGIVR